MGNFLSNFMSDCNLFQLISSPTRNNCNNVLDLLLTNNIQLLHSYDTTPTIKKIRSFHVECENPLEIS